MTIPHPDWGPAHIDNPYWKLVKPYVGKEPDRIWRSYTIGGFSGPNDSKFDGFIEVWKNRKVWTVAFAWSITAPTTVGFVADNARGTVIDPMAGTGYWPYLLRQLGIPVSASDLNPPEPDSEANHWHRNTGTYVPVLQADAVDAAALGRPGDTLFLSWPPYDDPVAGKALATFGGNRLIYIGEGSGGCTGDDSFHELLEKEWTLLADQPVVQYDGLHDVIFLYDRNEPLTGS